MTLLYCIEYVEVRFDCRGTSRLLIVPLNYLVYGAAVGSIDVHLLVFYENLWDRVLMAEMSWQMGLQKVMATQYSSGRGGGTYVRTSEASIFLFFFSNETTYVPRRSSFAPVFFFLFHP